MNKEVLKEYAKKNYFNLDFETNGIGMTWGVSYIRMTVGLKSKFENLEHFFFSTLKLEKNQTSNIYGQPTWADRTELQDWVENLKIKEVKHDELIHFITGSNKQPRGRASRY